MALINMILSGKGGVGKSYISAILAEYYQGQGKKIHCFDTDPVNPTFAGFKTFDVKHIKLSDKFGEITPRYFDNLIEYLLNLKKDDVAIIDNGASSFLPLCSYLAENDVFAFLGENGHEVRLHGVIAGGDAFEETTLNLNTVLGNFADISMVVWLNNYFGECQINGKTFEDSRIYQENENRFYALINLPAFRSETFGYDVREKQKKAMAFKEAIASPDFSIMARQRLKSAWRDLSEKMDLGQL